MAGYSTTPLVEKLGLKDDFRVSFPGAPAEFLDLLRPIPEGVVLLSPRNVELDLIVFFTLSRTELSERFADLAGRLVPSGILWIGWPKKASKVETDLDENIVREIGLAAGLVDVKVCAIDDVWSGLKFVYRVKDREKAHQDRERNAVTDFRGRRPPRPHRMAGGRAHPYKTMTRPGMTFCPARLKAVASSATSRPGGESGWRVDTTTRLPPHESQSSSR